CQPRLCTRRARALERVEHAHVPVGGERPREAFTLVEAAFTLAFFCKRDWRNREALLDDVDRPAQARHARRHPGGDGMPAAVLELVHDRRARTRVHPADRAARAHVRRQERAPAAAVPFDGMAAPIAAWG